MKGLKVGIKELSGEGYQQDVIDASMPPSWKLREAGAEIVECLPPAPSTPLAPTTWSCPRSP